MTTELKNLCERADEFYARGDAFGGSGNLSVRIGEDVWITPTGCALKDLKPEVLARISMNGESEGGRQPSKEYPFHLAIYHARPDVNGIVHLHAPFSVAMSCLSRLDEPQPSPPLTPYYVMRVAPLGVVDYFRPGSAELAAAVGEKAESFDNMLMRNHGLICTGRDFKEAADRALELEETCRLFFTLRGHDVRALTAEEVRELEETFGRK